jgi:hypothetical protein
LTFSKKRIDLASLGLPFFWKIPASNKEASKAVPRTAFVFLCPHRSIQASLMDLFGHKKTATYVAASFLFGCLTRIRT